MKRLLCTLLCLALMLPAGLRPARAAQLEHIQAADRLYGLGLVSGTGVDASGRPVYELDRAPTRSEAITVLVKLLGKADEASKGGWQMPFTDVPDWAKNFVGYAYQNGLTSGTSATTFGGNDPVTAAQYITFVLKALGYSANGDFAWDRAWELSDRLGVTDGRYTEKTSVFLRGDVFLISEAALHVPVKDRQDTLAQTLISAQVFSRGLFHQVYGIPMPELNAEQVFAQCSPSVFYVEVYDRDGQRCKTGSGFFLSSSGLAVTNHHVLDGASRAVITTSDTRKTYEVKGIYDYDEENDWVLMQVDGTGFASLEVGLPDTVQGGATVYAIGSPLGLQNTISQGLVSNPSRVLDGVTFIQTSAAISHGSSGGALINKYGQVVGITSAGFDGGQNLNLAMPMTVLEGADRTQLKPLSATMVKPVSVSYELGATSVTVEVGSSTTVWLNVSDQNIDDTVTYSVGSTDESVAEVVWDDMDDEPLPWDIRITGLKAGSAKLVVSNDKTDQTVSIPITVTAKTTTRQAQAFDRLKAFIRSNANTKDGSYMVRVSDGVILELVYNAKDNDISVIMDYMGKTGEYEWLSFLYLTADDSSYFTSCWLYDDELSGGHVRGTLMLRPSLIDTDEEEGCVWYTDFEGEKLVSESLGKMHYVLLQYSTGLVDRLLQEYTDGRSSIRDFGFVNM